jgi:Spy/CpxP family protein refolding chaperone
MKRAIGLVLLFLAATPAFAQLPPGKWWRRPQIVQNLSLTAEQQDRLDAIFRGAANDLIDTKADLDKATIALRGELDKSQLDRAALRAIAQRINQARSRKFERELMMLADMRGVLTDQQWNHMRAELDRFREQEQEKPRPKMRR